jgi:hypothetical protein
MSVDPGRPNAPAGELEPATIIWERTPIPPSWWRNAHALAPTPMAFTTASGRFSGPGLVPVLYLADNPLTAFWESGLGRDLNARTPENRALREGDLLGRIEYRVRVRPKNLRILNATDPASRRSIGARTIACFSAGHDLARKWAMRLHEAGADGILYESARNNPGRCLALFETPRSTGCLVSSRRVGSAYDNAALLGALFAEGVSIIGP